MHIADGILRARIDGELSENEALAAQKHLEACARCRMRASEIAAQAERVNALLSAAVPAGSVDAEAAWNRLQTPPPRRSSWRLRPAWGLLAAGVAGAALLISPPGRAVAQRILGLLRVRAVVVVPMERDVLADGRGKLLGQLLSDSVKVTKEEPAQTAATRDEASKLAGFIVRLPGARPDAPRLMVEGARSLYFTAQEKRLETLLGILGRPDLKLPEGLDGARIVVDVPRAVRAAYGNCPGNSQLEWLGCLMVIQAPAPTVVTLPELDLNRIAEAALELAGMTPQEAHDFSRAVDWTSTLAIPLPRNAASFENVTVGGAGGVLITERARGTRPPGWAVIWVKDGIIYSVNGFGDPGPALALAGSLG